MSLIDLNEATLENPNAEKWALKRSSDLLATMLAHDSWKPEVK